MSDETSYSLLRDGSGDLLLSIVSYLNVTDGAKFGRTCRRAFYLIQQYRRLRGPEFVAAAAASNRGPPLENDALVRKALEGIQGEPTICLSFQTNRNTTFSNSMLPKLPPSTICLGVKSTNIQSVMDGRVECASPAGLFLGTLPAASTAMPFVWAAEEGDDCTNWTTERFLPQLIQATEATNPTFWKVMIVYATHGASAQVENFLHMLQNALPQLQIVGGICQGGYVSQPHDAASEDWNTWSSHDLVTYLRNTGVTVDPSTSSKAELVKQVHQTIQTRPYHLCHVGDEVAASHGEGIIGVVLGGEVPVETVVSRGVKSIITHGPPTPTSDYVVHEAEFRLPTDDAYMFNTGPDQDGLPAYHMIRSVRDKQTGRTIMVPNWIQTHGSCDLVGLRYQQQHDGFALHSAHPLSRNLGGFLFFQDSTLPMTSLEGAEIDLYTLDGPACRNDVHSTLQALQQEVKGQKLLGGCMFSCAARGPAPNMLGEKMADAAAWATHFPTVPLLGWYAGGEVGPMAMAGRKNAMRGRDATQKATLQGFTAVFALWIVPVIDWTTVHLDDAAET
eukprot:scaffold43063_cov214-Amphora_coffeaeformis.AAC.2